MYYLAVDIGASGGRHILGSVSGGRIFVEEIYRFQNGYIRKNGHLCWDTDRLFGEIINGMKKCAELGKKPGSMGIDCFGVDFVLLDKNNNIIGDTVTYRDSRTEGAVEAVDKIIPREALYDKTGAQSAAFQSVYQLYSIRNSTDDLDRAKRFLQLPDYFNFLLTGASENEFTNSSTTQLVNAAIKDFDGELLDLIGIPRHIFKKPVMPMTVLGSLKPEVVSAAGFDCKVVLPATHDTVSALTAVPSLDDCIFISSGTWSLMGTFLKEPNMSSEGMNAGFSNAYVHDGRIGYIKSIMGLWIIQSIKREMDNKYSFGELCGMARRSDYGLKINVNDNRFLAPGSMTGAIKNYLLEHGSPGPETPGDILNCVYHSLAESYAEAAREIELITGKKYGKIHIVGGGSRDEYLNGLTARYTGKDIYTGPAEATAIGNLTAQFIAAGEFGSVSEARDAVLRSFDVKKSE